MLKPSICTGFDCGLSKKQTMGEAGKCMTRKFIGSTRTSSTEEIAMEKKRVRRKKGKYYGKKESATKKREVLRKESDCYGKKATATERSEIM